MNIKKILVFGILGLMLASGAGLGCKLFSKKDEGEAAAAEGAEGLGEGQAEAAKAPAPSQPPSAPHFPPEDEDDGGIKVAANYTTIINLTSAPGAKSTFLKVQLSVIVADEELGKAMASPSPTFESEKSKSIIRESLLKLTPEEIDDNETQLTFAQDIKDQLNELFRPRPSTGGDKKKEKKEEKEKEKDAPPRPLRPIKEVLIIEWQFQR
ncbi:MAG: flagellar basal body-associated FliL family protein [Holophagales bacterium]|nr:flagellar basal body-associated FliL family protein [Holophagales bacterium]